VVHNEYYLDEEDGQMEFVEYGKPYVIAEIGANHNGDMDLAKKMIDVAKKCGADCVKFQSWTKNSIFSKKVYEDNYFLADDYRNRTDYTLEAIVDKYHIGVEQHRMLKKYCDEIGIDFNSTPFSKPEVDLLVDELKVPFVKVASMDLNNIPFLKYIASKKIKVVISTGLCELSDVSDAVKCLKTNGCPEIILLHCVSIYPPEDRQVNLNNIDMLRQTFGCKVGYSDHTLGIVAPIMSIAKGVCIIEKHFTLDKNMEGWDHKISANPDELKSICNASKIGYKMLGSYTKVVSENQERREAFQRSIVAARDINKGDIIKEDDLAYKRPGTGIPPKFYEFIIGKQAKRDIRYDEIIKLEDF
jgi:N-acetylneuraminate synthase